MCNYHRQQYRVPVCQNTPGDPVDAAVVQAFFEALSPLELNAYEQASTAKQEMAQKTDQAQQQQLERLHYEAALAERQFNRVDPDNRLVAAELEKRWEAALSSLKQAQQTYAAQSQDTVTSLSLPPELKAAFTDLGHKLPQIWDQDILTRQIKKALLRTLIDKVVIHRPTPEFVHTRIVWKGGDTSTLQVPVPVGSLNDLSGAQEMEKIIIELGTAGQSDEAVAEHLTTLGYRSPMTPYVLPSTVKNIRLKHRIFLKRSQSHPRRVPGYLTLPQIAQALDISPYWLYHRIDIGQIQVSKDPTTGLYLFPDDPHTLEQFEKFIQGFLHNLRF